jgi:hypothetical protein
MGNNLQKSRNEKQAGVTILIYDNINFKPKQVRRDKGSHYILIKE